MNENYVINLGRQLGSGGKEIGEKLAKEFGIAFYDKELIKLASDESGLCVRSSSRKPMSALHKASSAVCLVLVSLLSVTVPSPMEAV